MRLTISNAVLSIGSFLIVALGLTIGLSSYALYQLRVGGPNYERIVAGKDLIADILPPPLYIVEAYLEARVALVQPAELRTHTARLAQLRRDFNDRRAFWEVSTLVPGDLKDELIKVAAVEATKFWLELEQAYLPALERGNKQAAGQSLKKLTGSYAAHRSVVDRVVARANTFASLVEAESNRQKAMLEAIVLAAAGLMLLFLLGAIVVLRQHVVRPVVVLASYLSRLAQADYSEEVPFQARTDEIGEMGRSVVTLREAAMERVRLAREAEQVRARRDEIRRQAEEEAIARERGMVNGSIGAGMAQLAAKDLTFRLTDALPEAYAKLQGDFNAAMGQLEQAVQSVNETTHAMHSGTHEISTASDELARRTEQQAASLEEAAASLEEITATVKKTAEGVARARGLVAAAKEDAEKSGEVARKVVDAMGSIEQSSQQIGQIIGVIDEIAFQTNLLALNAGVEAARAGDAGRGFAVVASEVRALAQRSAEAAKEIKNLISTSRSQVEQGVALVGETGPSLERIVAKVIEINVVIGDIATGAQGAGDGTAAGQYGRQPDRPGDATQRGDGGTGDCGRPLAGAGERGPHQPRRPIPGRQRADAAAGAGGGACAKVAAQSRCRRARLGDEHSCNTC